MLAVLPAADYAHSQVVDIILRASNGGPVSGVRAVNGVPQAWPLTILPTMDVSTITRLPDGHLLVGLLHTADMATGTYTGGGTLCSADDGTTWSPGC